jgi:hypothetical protein
MRTIDFSQVLFNALQFSGNDRHNIMPETFSQFRDFASTRLREAWETFEWPDVCRVVPFNSTTATVSSAYGDSTPGISVFYANNTDTGNRSANNPVSTLPYSQQIPAGLNRTQLLIQNKGNTTIELSLATAGATVSIYADQSIAFQDYNGGFSLSSYTGVTVLEAFLQETANSSLYNVKFFTPAEQADEILAVFDKNPLSSSKATQSTYTIYNDGSKRIVTTLESGWYVYRIKCPELIGDLFEAGIQYSPGAQVYWDEGSGSSVYEPVPGKPHKGNFYNCVAPTSAGESPTSRPDKWVKINIPYVFGSFMSWGSTSNWLVSEGMVQEAAVIESKANEALEMEYDKATRQQGQYNRLAMIRNY